MVFQIHIRSTINGLVEAVNQGLQRNKTLRDKFNVITIKDMKLEVQNSIDILLGEPKLVVSILEDFKKVSWIQSTYAGVEPFFTQSSRRDFVLTRCGGTMGVAMTQYVTSWIIANERNFQLAATHQANKEWNPISLRYRLFHDVTIGVLGYGNIGNEIGNILQKLGFQVYGFRRNVHLTSSSQEMVKITNSLEEVLSVSDYIINILPSTPQSTQLLSGSTLKVCKKKSPVFINVGRGDVVDEATLIHALNEKWISSAILDVFPEEPLPKTSPLWEHPNIYITPHVAALSIADEVAKTFLANLERFVVDGNCTNLQYQVDWQKGY